MAKKKFELVGVGRPSHKFSPSGIPVTCTAAGSLTTVYVFGLHPSDVMDGDSDEREVIGNRELAEDALATVQALWRWFDDQRDEAGSSYLCRKTELEEREKRTVN